MKSKGWLKKYKNVLAEMLNKEREWANEPKFDFTLLWIWDLQR